METGLPVWVGISTSRGPGGTMIGWDIASEEGGRLPDGYEPPPREPLETIIDAITALGPQATGIMHSSLRATTPGLEVLFGRWSGPVMAYPEAMSFDAESHLARVLVEPEDFAARCRGWVESGVQIIGGCCGTTIRHIRAMVDQLPHRPGPRPGTPRRIRESTERSRTTIVDGGLAAAKEHSVGASRANGRFPEFQAFTCDRCSMRGRPPDSGERGLWRPSHIQLSTFKPWNARKSPVFGVTSTRSLAWAMAAIGAIDKGGARPTAARRSLSRPSQSAALQS